MDKKIFGNLLKGKREAKGKTIAEFADLVKVSPPTIGRWESGKTSPRTLSVYRQVARVYELTPTELTTLAGIFLTEPFGNGSKDLLPLIKFITKTELTKLSSAELEYLIQIYTGARGEDLDERAIETLLKFKA